jgi:hypothetical protein
MELLHLRPLIRRGREVSSWRAFIGFDSSSENVDRSGAGLVCTVASGSELMKPFLLV